ncbi:hypothetical protein [Pelagerythrobacter marensis]|uniref:Lipoprotein n=1 Tax=Pelagerythrobacter marensis TaxID=543877 RepID=A0A0G3X4F8_9SPHN|nr:hypothetical protein [Pelagerythrobacter marensis]AKM06455.1 hypothetical protein AM2010_367 [Pelagerythrobacter marensis]
MKKALACALLSFGLIGCATVKNNYVPQREQISFPALYEVQTVTLGEQMLAQGTATTTRGVYLPEENNIKGFILSRGFYPQTGQDGDFVFTSFETRTNDPEIGQVSLKGGLFGQLIYPRGLRFDTSKQETCAIVPNMYGLSQPICDTEYSYQFTERPFVSPNDFQQTLIYSGRVSDKIRASYREFSGNMARSAFTNEAEYDLSQSKIIAYKGAKIEVIDANNEEITYRVLSNFNLGGR